MTLEEAIKHCEAVAKDQEKLCKRYDDASGYTRSHNEDIRTTDAKRCEECAKEHRQLAEWLKELKALKEQEPCEDAISRQAVLDGIAIIAKAKAKSDAQKSLMGRVLFFTEHLPSVTPQPKQRWIPVSERLPEDIKPVIVTWKNTDPKSYYQYIVGKHFIGTAYYKNGKWFWYSSVTEDLLAEYGKCDSEEFDEAIEVVAWMPLPEPYKAESEDKAGEEE